MRTDASSIKRVQSPSSPCLGLEREEEKPLGRGKKGVEERRMERTEKEKAVGNEAALTEIDLSKPSSAAGMQCCQMGMCGERGRYSRQAGGHEA